MEEENRVSKNISTPMNYLNSTTIHVLSEIVVFAGVFFYFKTKISNLNKQIEELKNELDDQDETLQRHEEILRRLVGKQSQQVPLQSHNKPVQTQESVQPVSNTQVHPIIPLQNAVQPSSDTQVHPIIPSTIPNENHPAIVELTGDDLDKELQDELNEMNKA